MNETRTQRTVTNNRLCILIVRIIVTSILRFIFGQVGESADISLFAPRTSARQRIPSMHVTGVNEAKKVHEYRQLGAAERVKPDFCFWPV